MKNYQVSSCFFAAKEGKVGWLRMATQLKNCGNPQLVMSFTDELQKRLSPIDSVIWGNANVHQELGKWRQLLLL